jgi:chemotaxis protein methyltransferase CheR
MNDRDCVRFLRWALPRMGMRWKGFRKVRRQVCRRIRDRMVELGLAGVDDYMTRLEEDPGEWKHLAFLARVTISRFGRDREVFRVLRERILPELASGGSGPIRVWSAGCASGEEPYTLTILWRLHLQDRFPDRDLRILATDIDPVVLERARRGVYPRGALRDLDSGDVERAFDEVDPERPDPGQGRERQEPDLQLRDEFRKGVSFREEDILGEMPDGRFELIFCRNLVFTYFDEETQVALLPRFLDRLVAGTGWLVLGGHEELPPGRWPLERPWAALPLYHSRPDPT